MALKPSTLKQIPQRNKDLAFGYVREHEIDYNSNYSQLIKYLVLLYSNQQDKFDVTATHPFIKINQNCIVDQREVSEDVEVHHSYLQNIATKGIHIWKFKFNAENSGSQMIGIWKIKSGKIVLDGPECDNTNDGENCTGYGITMNGLITNPENPSRFSHVTYDKIGDGDIIEMRLDLNKSLLTFKCNDTTHSHFKHIENTAYRAVVTTYKKNDKFKLLYYQQFD